MIVKKLNNKGFTLVELLAVLVILIAIMSIAIPSISSSLERSKDKQNSAKIRLVKSAAELYVTDYKNKISSSTCYIDVDQLINEGYISNDDILDSDSEVRLVESVVFNKSDNSYCVLGYDNSCVSPGNPCVS